MSAATMRREAQHLNQPADAREAIGFAAFKWHWLAQVHADHALPATAHSVAFWLASKYLNAKSRECWPSQETLAADTGLKERWVRKMLAHLVDRGHLLVRRSGKGTSNRYRPVLHDRHYCAGHSDPLTGTYEPFDRHDNAANTGTYVPPNLKMEPVLEPDPHLGIGDTYTIEDDEDARVSARSSQDQPVDNSIFYRVNEWIKHPEFGRCLIEEVTIGNIYVRSGQHGDIRIGRDQTGRADFTSSEVIDGDEA